VDGDGKLVGIITKGDITRGILNALKQDYQAKKFAAIAPVTYLRISNRKEPVLILVTTSARGFHHGGEASSKIKRSLTGWALRRKLRAAAVLPIMKLR
jgi:hypothetical protein